MIQLTEQFAPVKLNAEKEGTETARKYQVRGFPTILFVNGSGVVEGQIGGYMPPGPFAAQLVKIARAHRELPGLEARLRSNPTDARVAGSLASIYAGRGESAKAERVVSRLLAANPTSSRRLAATYNAIGDSYQEAGNFDRAVPWFRKAIRAGTTPRDVVYARLSVAVCHLSTGRQALATPELRAALAVKNAPPDLRAEARRLLEQVTRRQGQGQ